MRNAASADGGCRMSALTVDAILDGEDDLASRPTHIRPDCECRIVEAPLPDINDILQSDGIPILNLEPNGTDKLGLVARPYNDTTKYVVIWHRPDDHFASARYSTITTCQLIRLADRLGALHHRLGGEEICFWMQSLCLPGCSDDSEEDEARALKAIYSKAYALLIMDSEWLGLHQPAQQTYHDYIMCLKSDHPELICASRVLLIGPSGFHIEMDEKALWHPAASGDIEQEDIR